MKPKKAPLFAAIICSAALPRAFAAFPTIPTFDWSNLANAVESACKAAQFYEDSVRQTEIYIAQMERFAKAIDSGDFRRINAGITDSLKMLGDMTERISEIAKMAEDRRLEAELTSKRATLDIVRLFAKPSPEELRNYAKRHLKKGENPAEAAKTIADDTVKALELILNDHSKTADVATKEIDSSMVSLLRTLGENLDATNAMSAKSGESAPAQESLGTIVDQLIFLRQSADDASAKIDGAKTEIADVTDSIRREIETWSAIGESLGESAAAGEKLRQTAERMKITVNGART